MIFAQQECSSANLLERLNSFNSEASTWEMIRFMKAAVKLDRTIDLGPYAGQKRQEPCNGFVFPSSKHITTNAHCLTFVSNIEVEFQSGEKIPVKGVSYYGNYQDIAVLELVKEAPTEAVLSLSRYSADSMVGQKVFR